MIVALSMEKSQSSKNALVAAAAARVCKKYGHTFFNYGPYSNTAPVLPSYGQMAILNATLLNAGAADLVLTGCGTGMGALIATNAFPNVECGFAADPLDARLLREVNHPNAIVTPFDKGWGWAAEYNLELMYEELLATDREMYLTEKTDQACIRCKNELGMLKRITHTSMLEVLQKLDLTLLQIAFGGERFKEYFYANAKDEKILAFVKNVMED